MKKELRFISLLIAAACSASLLAACGSTASTTVADSTAETAIAASTADTNSEHEPLTMTAMVPFRNPSRLKELVKENTQRSTLNLFPTAATTVRPM